jgi:DNA-binding NtrC family response regulator
MLSDETNILIIDDDPDILFTTRVVLKPHFTHIRAEKKPDKINQLLGEEEFDAILLDMNFKRGAKSGKEGLEWLKKIKSINKDHNVILITAYGEVEIAVEAMKEGAFDFVVKPWDNNKLIATVMAACQLNKSKKELKKYRYRENSLREDIDKPFKSIIGKSQAMQHVFGMIDKVGQTDASVLILGENGTGKELIARELHRKSKRMDQLFINVDLGAIPESLFESELFGHTKGAFTDAIQDRAGRFEVASGGTLFLDEIGNLSLPLQAKLLSALESRKIYRIGSNKEIPIDIRLICATNMPLYDMINSNRFRVDLLYRINTVEIFLPPLRNKREDIPELVDHFMGVFARKYKKGNLTVHSAALKKLAQYDWPGNIRELQHVVERAVIMSENICLQPGDFLLSSQENKSLPEGSLNIEAIEKNAIIKSLIKHGGNMSKAAVELGMGRTTLYRKMKKHGI